MSELAIVVDRLGKRYRIGTQRAKGDGLRHALEAAVRAPFARLGSRSGRPAPTREYWALKDVSFAISPGEVVGIIGPNGAGKSTLLKLLSRITVPSEGRIRIEGRVASLLEVGTGFHPELTGRENIFLNGAILGMNRAEIVRKFDEIVAFSEIEEFLDTPVKRYSSGMYVRLAFAVAAHLEPQILIVDEVLAVGDASFQRKCLGKMDNIAQSGKTVLFVSHNMDAIRNLCQRAVWLSHGHMERDGSAEDVIEAYFNRLSAGSGIAGGNPAYGLKLERVCLRNSRGEEATKFRPGDELNVEVAYHASVPVELPYLTIGILGVNGPCFTANMLLDGHRPGRLQGAGRIGCRFQALPLLPQSYTVNLAIRAKDGHDWIFPYQAVASFSVAANLAEFGYKGEFLARASRYTPVVVPYEWRLPDGTEIAVSLESPRVPNARQ